MKTVTLTVTVLDPNPLDMVELRYSVNGADYAAGSYKKDSAGLADAINFLVKHRVPEQALKELLK